MQQKKIFLPITFGLITMSLVSIGQTTTGKISLSKGLKFQIENNTNSVISQEVMGQTIEIKMDLQALHQVEVKDKKDSSYILTSTFKKLKTTGSAMGKDLNFDSDKKEDMDSEIGQAIKDQLNVPKDVELSDHDKVIKNPGSTTKKEQKTAEGMGNMMQNILGGENDETNGAGNAFEAIPAGLKTGDQWSDSSITKESKTYRQFSIKDIKDNIVSINLTGKQAITKQVEQMGMDITVTTDGKITGEIIVDQNTGFIQKKSLIIDTTGTMEASGMSVPLSSKTTTVFTVKNL